MDGYIGDGVSRPAAAVVRRTPQDVDEQWKREQAWRQGVDYYDELGPDGMTYGENPPPNPRGKGLPKERKGLTMSRLDGRERSLVREAVKFARWAGLVLLDPGGAAVDKLAEVLRCTRGNAESLMTEAVRAEPADAGRKPSGRAWRRKRK